MSSYIVTYDLVGPNRDYQKIIAAIKQLSGYWCHVSESSWAVKVEGSSAVHIRDTLIKSVDSNDQVFVAKLTGEAAWWNLGKEKNDWLMKYL